MSYKRAANIIPFPSTDLITGDIEAKLAHAREVAQWVERGHCQSLATMIVARDALATHGHDTDVDAETILDAAILASRKQMHRAARAKDIRDAAWDGLIFLVFAAVVLIVVLSLGGM